MLPFSWNFKARRIARQHLHKPKSKGGLALPNFMLYDWASTINSFTFWLHTTVSPPVQLKMEKEDCHPYSIGAILLALTLSDQATYNCDPIIHNLIRIWRQIKFHFGIKSISLALPITRNPTFITFNLDKTFCTWSDFGIHSVQDLYIEGTCATFTQLQKKFNPPNSNFFRYLQVRDYIRKYLNSKSKVHQQQTYAFKHYHIETTVFPAYMTFC